MLFYPRLEARRTRGVSMWVFVGSIPYCGLPPLPGGATWNFDPFLLAVLAAGTCLYTVYARRHSLSRIRICACGIGWALLSTVLISPLCNLSVALFSARIAQHMLIMLVAAPLLVVGGADLMLERAWVGRPHAPGNGVAVGSVLVFSAALWVWHVPGPYDATFRSDTVYWLMHISLAATAVALWHVILRAELARAVIAGAAAAVQMTGLGTILTLAPYAFYQAHLTTTWPWGLAPEDDQALGGIIMWVPGGLVLALILLWTFAARLQALDLAQSGARR